MSIINKDIEFRGTAGWLAGEEIRYEAQGSITSVDPLAVTH